MMRIILTGFLIMNLLPIQVLAQDVSFSQFFSNPLYLNPAFSGSLGVPRLALQYRNQWQGFDNAYGTYSAGIDFTVEKLQGGLGLLILNDTQAGNSLNLLQVSASYSVFIRISDNYRLHGGIQAGNHQYRLDAGKLVFADNLDPFYGNHGISEEVAFFPDFSITYPDFAAGLLLYSDKYFGGLAVHHLTEPQQNFYTDNLFSNVLPRKYAAHFGARVPVNFRGYLRNRLFVSPQLVMQFQDNFGQVNYGMFSSYEGISAGTWFRQNLGLQYDALILMLGFAKKQWQINYSYDIAVSGLWGQTGGTSEISLVFLLKSINRESHLPFYHNYGAGKGFQ